MNRGRSARRWVGLATVCVAALGAKAAGPNLTGVYADPGIAVELGPDHQRETMSLQALLGQDFDPVSTRTTYAESARIEIKQSVGWFELKVCGADGKVQWSRQWRNGSGFVVDGDRVNLRFPASHHKYDDFVFSLSNAGDGQLLQVEVRRLTATYLGPALGPASDYLFYRLTGTVAEK